MEGRGRGRGRGQAPEQQLNVAEVAGGILAGAALGYGAYKLYRAVADKPHEEEAHPEWNGGSSSWFNKLNMKDAMGFFWKNVEEIQEEEVSACENESLVFQGPSGNARNFKHKYNKFDLWFENLLRNIIRVDASEKREFQEAFTECLETLLSEMETVDPLFRFLHRNIYPAGSSWENLKLYSYNEYDVNVVLSPVNIQSDAEVSHAGCGHVAIKLMNGFHVRKEDVMKKLCNDPKWELYHASITEKLKKWTQNSYVSRFAVLHWLQGTVDLALHKLNYNRHSWSLIQGIKRSLSGPAITLNVVMKNGKEFSVDLVPVFEFTQKHLPSKIKQKVEAKPRLAGYRTWFAVPKGPTRESESKLWRTSLYEMERDLMRGHYHLKPGIKIIKRLREVQEWKALSSYFIKSIFMEMMDYQDVWGFGLGQTIMQAMKSLEESFQTRRINYYWDADLNLLNNAGNEEFYRNACSRMNRIIKKFENSCDDDSIDPMHCFGCDKEGNNLLRSPLSPSTFLRTESNSSQFDNFSPPRNQQEPDCAVM